MPRSKGDSDLPVGLRGGILALHIIAKMSYTEISSALKVHPATASAICKKAETRVAENGESYPPDTEEDGISFEKVRALFAAVEDDRAEKWGQPEKIPKGSAEANALRNLILSDAEHQDMPWPEVAKELGLEACRATIERVVHKHLDIHRYTPRLKPPLNMDGMVQRVDFSVWALAKLDQGAIFVFTDETWVEIGGVRRHKKVSRPKGANPYDYSRPKKRTTLRVMFWGSMAIGYKGPSYIWAKETKEEKKINNQIVADLNAVNTAQVEHHRRQALIQGTEEYRILKSIHEKVVNGPRTATGRQYPRPPPQWIWTTKKIERKGSAGGIDWVRYGEKILYLKLYPFLQRIQRENPGQEIWLVEDNAPAHVGATSYDPRWSQEMTPLGINRCQWPPNSPDINEIEPVWDDLKDSIEAEGPFTGASKETAQRVKTAMYKCWNELSDEGIRNRCEDFRYKLELVVRNGGRNNFNG